jgi:sugar O-acyltransferase (sialic acid O-acetyltransferase NeuD family)
VEYDVLGFIVQSQFGKPGDIVNDQPILGDFSWFESNAAGDVYAICALGEPYHRRHIVETLRRTGVRFCTVIHPSVMMTRWITMGVGVYLGQGSMLADQVRIGNYVSIVGASTIGHDVVLEDFATITHGVHVSGKVTIREGSYIGVGANIIDKVSIGAWSVVGAGTTIVKDVPENSTVVGVAGKVIKTRPAGWQNHAE